MAEQKPQKKNKVVNLADIASVDDLEKIEEYQPSTDGAFPVDNEWMILAEWLRIAGYQAYLDARDDVMVDGQLIVTPEEIMTLIAANRKLDALRQYRDTEAAFIGAISAKQKKPSGTFKKLTKNIIKMMKVA